MKLRCPVCHASNSLEAFTADEAGRELLVLLAGTGSLFRPLVAYLGLFRPVSRDLSHQRALKLAQEVLALADPVGAIHESPLHVASLQQALNETVEAMRNKRQTGQVKPLTNHNYLKRVLETVGATDFKSEISDLKSPAPKGRRAQAISALGEWGTAGWLERHIAEGLAALIALGLDSAPSCDIIAHTADIWCLVVKKSGCTAEKTDSPRLQSAFKSLLQQPLKRWPEPAALIAQLPRKREQQKLEAPPISEQERVAGRQKLKELQAQLAKGMSL